MKGTPGADASTLFKHIKDYLLWHSLYLSNTINQSSVFTGQWLQWIVYRLIHTWNRFITPTFNKTFVDKQLFVFFSSLHFSYFPQQPRQSLYHSISLTHGLFDKIDSLICILKGSLHPCEINETTLHLGPLLFLFCPLFPPFCSLLCHGIPITMLQSLLSSKVKLKICDLTSKKITILQM